MPGCERHADTSSEALEELIQLLRAVDVSHHPRRVPMKWLFYWVSAFKRFVGGS